MYTFYLIYIYIYLYKEIFVAPSDNVVFMNAWQSVLMLRYYLTHMGG